MNLNKIKYKIIGNTFYGVEVCFQGEDIKYYITLVKKNKDLMSVDKTFEVANFKTLKEKLVTGVPVVLCFSGSGIINKIGEVIDKNYKSKILYNSNPNDFYWNEFLEDDKLYISISRKAAIDIELNKWESNNIYVIKAYLGPFVAVNFYKITNYDAINMSVYNLKFKNDNIDSFASLDNNLNSVYKIGNQNINSNHVLGFSVVLDFLFPNQSITNTISYTDSSREEFLYKKIFSKVGIFFVLFLFCSLLISFFLLQFYNNKINITSSLLSKKQITYNQVKKLKNDKENKDLILKKSGIYNNNFLTFYVWKLVDVIPKSIQLTKINIFPSTKKVKKKQPITFNTDFIEIAGYVKINKSLTNWIKKIKKYDWVKSLEIIDFKNENSKKKFTLKIIIKSNV